LLAAEGEELGVIVADAFGQFARTTARGAGPEQLLKGLSAPDIAAAVGISEQKRADHLAPGARAGSDPR
jgi:hypothetical protein